MEQYRSHQISLPDYDMLKEAISKLYKAYQNDAMNLTQAKAGLLICHIQFKVVLSDIIQMWNVQVLYPCDKLTEEEVDNDVVHTTMMQSWMDLCANMVQA